MLTLGIIGLVICPVCSIIALAMGTGDLRAMREGHMDPSGHGPTKSGVVCAIVGLALCALVALWIASAIGLTTRGPVFEGGRGTARAQIANLSHTVQLYLVRTKSLPPTLEALTEHADDGIPFLDRLPSDPWDSPYEYRVVNVRAKEYEIWSNGEDRQPGTEDDLLYNSRTGWRVP